MTVESTHLYGCHDADIDTVAKLIGPQLDLQLEGRDSSYWGDYYIDRSGAYNELRLYRNRDPLYQPGADDPEDYWFEPEFRECPTILSVYASAPLIAGFRGKIAKVTPVFRLLRATNSADA